MYHIFSNKNGVLYFRYVVPKSVLVHFPKLQKTYNRSLGTSYRREAKIKAACLFSEIHTRLELAMELVDKFLSGLDTTEKMVSKVSDELAGDKKLLQDSVANSNLVWMR